MKFALGTAQFGFVYGLANTTGRIENTEAHAVMSQAKKSGFDTLDTAISYGDSERTLGSIGIDGWRVVTKLPAVSEHCKDVQSWVRNEIQRSMERLRVEQLYGVLLHCPGQLLQSNGYGLYKGLKELKDQGLTRKIGISIYSPTELDMLLNYYDFDLVQAPLNILDRRLIDTGWARRLKDRNIELHSRSTFLQGLLLMPGHQRPLKFRRWADVWAIWDDWLLEINMTPLEACLRYLKSIPEIDRIVVGVDTKNHVKQIIKASEGSLKSLPKFQDVLDDRLVNPSAWPELEVKR